MTDWIGVVGGSLGGAAAIYTALRFNTIEHLKATLQKEIYEHQTRFSRLHEKRLEVITDLYAKLVEVEIALSILVAPLRLAGTEGVEVSEQRAMKAFNDLFGFFSKRRVFLPSDLAQDVEALVKSMRQVTADFQQIRLGRERDGATDYVHSWSDAWEVVRDRIPGIRASIEDRFRRLLGSEDL